MTLDAYEILDTLGEGSYGIVYKARHKETNIMVAMKKFKDTDDDDQVRKTAMREIRILKQMRHDNIINLLDVFKRKGKLYLIFEYVEQTVLEALEKHLRGFPEEYVRRSIFQILKGIEYCHDHNIIHRDVKPENLLVSKHGVIKLCDFGFARTLNGAGAKYTDYVSTRWYRAPELLVGDREYGPEVDIWAIGCLFAEMLTGLPLFPGESDIDQLFHIVKCFGELSNRQTECFGKNPLYTGIKLPFTNKPTTLESSFPNVSASALSFLKACLQCDPQKRYSASDLLHHEYLSGCSEWYSMFFKHSQDKSPLYLSESTRKKHRKASLSRLQIEEIEREKDQREKEKEKEKREKESLRENDFTIKKKNNKKKLMVEPQEVVFNSPKSELSPSSMNYSPFSPSSISTIHNFYQDNSDGKSKSNGLQLPNIFQDDGQDTGEISPQVKKLSISPSENTQKKDARLLPELQQSHRSKQKRRHSKAGNNIYTGSPFLHGTDPYQTIFNKKAGRF